MDKMGYLVVRGEDVKRVFPDELAILVIENPAVSLTGCLIEALTEKKSKQYSAIPREVRLPNLFRNLPAS